MQTQYKTIGEVRDEFVVTLRALWWGDLDPSVDAADLTAFAKQQGETLYILSEKDAFGNGSPAFEAAVATVSKDGMMEFCESLL